MRAAEMSKEQMDGRVAELVARFRDIGETQMRGLPLYNDRTEVEAVDFAPFGDGWIGVLITPWFMNVVLLPRDKIEIDMTLMGKRATEPL